MNTALTCRIFVSKLGRNMIRLTTFVAALAILCVIDSHAAAAEKDLELPRIGGARPLNVIFILVDVEEGAALELRYFGSFASAAGQSASVPEPSTAVLAAIGLFGVLVFRSRRNAT